MSAFLEKLADFALRHEWGWLIAILVGLTALSRWGKNERQKQRLKESLSYEQTMSERVQDLKEDLEEVEARSKRKEAQFDRMFERLHEEWKKTREVLDFVVGKIQDDERLSWDPEEMQKYQNLMDDSDAFEADWTPPEGKDAV